MGIRGSYLAFGKLGGDHRGLLLDIPADFIFGFTHSDLVPPSARRLKLDNPAVDHKYNATLWKLITMQGLDTELETLHKKCAYPTTPEQKRQFERIDMKLLEAQYKAEKK